MEDYVQMNTKADDAELHDIRQKLAGLHFSQESLLKGEREILRLAERLLKRLDDEQA